MTTRFIICVDIDEDDLIEAYSVLYDRMAIICEQSILDWESSDEAYDENGEVINEDKLQEARMSKFSREGMNN